MVAKSPAKIAIVDLGEIGKTKRNVLKIISIILQYKYECRYS